MEQLDQRVTGILDNAALVLLVFYYINSGNDSYLVYCVGALLLIGATYSYYSQGNGKLWLFEFGSLALLAYWWFSVGFDSNLLYWTFACVVIACAARLYIIFVKK